MQHWTKIGRIQRFFSSVLTVPTSYKNVWSLVTKSCMVSSCPRKRLKQSLAIHHNSVHPFGQMDTSNPVERKGEADSSTAASGKIEITKRKIAEIEEPEHDSRRKKRRGGGGKKLPPGERYVPPPQKRNPGVSFSQEHFKETSYYFEGGLRKVYPYYFDFQTYCKGRWVGKSLLEVFRTEFRAEPLEYYIQAAKKGRIRLNEKPVEDLNIILKNNDFLRNTVHRHEPPVSAKPMEILVDDGELLVVDKPASLPVHPCGRFRHNTVIFILGKERGLSSLHTVHRLDRLTSGVLLFARTLEASQRLDQLVRDRQLEKEYVCRVLGVFPEGELVCEEPILVVSYKVGVCRVDPRGKPCRTVFHRLRTDGRSSVVQCRPLTGRTHQIRVHLQFLGHPILNDPIYCSAAWGPERGKGGHIGVDDEQLLRALVEEHRAKESLHLLDITEEDLPGGALMQGKEGVAHVSSCDVAESKCGADKKSCRSDEKAEVVSVCDFPEAELSNLHKDDSCTTERKTKFLTNSANKSIQSTDSVPGNHSGFSAAEPQCDTTVEVGHSKVREDLADNLGSERGCTKNKENVQREELDDTGTRSESPKVVKDPLCSECKIVRKDPTEKELIMYLHALKYKGPNFEYSTRLPDWAKEEWQED
nr:PREDICTED: RNA pseudouridylate synthase domain-containing protein 2 [Lepisosteus oculatus]